MKGFPPGYPANDHQRKTADRHAWRRNHAEPTAADRDRIAEAQRKRARQATGQGRGFQADMADLKRRAGGPLDTRDLTALGNGDGQ